MTRTSLRLTRLEGRCVPAVAVWDGHPDAGGAGADNKWTTATNWVGDVAPQPGDDLQFPAAAQQFFIANDFPAGTPFGTIRVNGPNYWLSGNAVRLAGGLTADQPFEPIGGAAQVSLPLTLAADQTFAVSGTRFNVPLILASPIDLNGHDLTVNASGGVSLTGVISGHGGLTVTGGGSVEIFGANTFDGPTTIDDFPPRLSPGTVNLAGRVGPITLTAGFLVGTGTAGSVTMTGGFINNFSFINNTNTAGGLTVGGLDQTGGAMNFHVGDAGFGPLTVAGAVRLGGTVSVFSNSPFTTGARYTLIDNDGTDPVQGAFAGAPEGAFVGGDQALGLRISYRGGDGNDVVLTAVPRPTTAVGAGAGGGPQVNVYDAQGVLMRSFLAYDPSFRGGVRVAVADVTGDRVNDIITAPGPGGGPDVRVWDGATGAMLREFSAYDPSFRGGVNLAAADLTGDGVADIVTGAGAGGGPHVRLFGGPTGAVVSEFLAYDPAFRGGVSVAAAEALPALNGSNVVIPGWIVTGPGPGGGPDVRTFTTDGFLSTEFLAYPPQFTGGVNVAVGTLTSQLGAAYAPFEIVTAPASAGGPDVRVWDRVTGALVREFNAYDPSFTGGVTLATIRVAANVEAQLLTGPGPGGGPDVRQWRYGTSGASPAGAPTLERAVLAFDPAFTGGVFVG